MISLTRPVHGWNLQRIRGRCPLWGTPNRLRRGRSPSRRSNGKSVIDAPPVTRSRVAGCGHARSSLLLWDRVDISQTDRAQRTPPRFEDLLIDGALDTDHANSRVLLTNLRA